MLEMSSFHIQAHSNASIWILRIQFFKVPTPTVLTSLIERHLLWRCFGHGERSHRLGLHYESFMIFLLWNLKNLTNKRIGYIRAYIINRLFSSSFVNYLLSNFYSVFPTLYRVVFGGKKFDFVSLTRWSVN